MIKVEEPSRVKESDDNNKELLKHLRRLGSRGFLTDSELRRKVI